MVIVKSLATPVVWVLVLLVVGLILTRRSRRRKGVFRIGWYAVLLGTILLFTLSLSLVADLLAYSLECRYSPPQPDVLDTVAIVVVLGGGVRPSGGLRVEAGLSECAYPRLYEGVKAFKASGASLLVCCGGRPWEGAESEAEVMKAMAIAMGVSEDRILAETRSHNTMQNAACLAELLPAGQDRQIGLVTTATHMLRSVKVFERHFAGDTIVPIPANYTSGSRLWMFDSFVPSSRCLERSTVALHEWLGLLWYWVRY